MTALLLQNLKLIMLFLLIATILALSIFGGEMQDRASPPAKRFTTASRGTGLVSNIDLGAARRSFESKPG